jgi:hypothetical protein
MRPQSQTWKAIFPAAALLLLVLAPAAWPGHVTAPPTQTTATIETEPVPHSGEAADDAAV